MTIALDPQISDTAMVGSHTQTSPAVSDPSCPDASQIADSMSASRPGTPTSSAAREGSHTQSTGAAGDLTSTRTGLGRLDTQTVPARPGGSQTSGAARLDPDAHTSRAAPEPTPARTGRSVNDTQEEGARPGGAHTSPAPSARSTPKLVAARGDSTTTGTIQGSCYAQIDPNRPGGWLRDPVIGVLADVLDDLEKVRIANANRVRILTRTEADSDGEERGFGLTEDHPEVKKLALTVKALEAAEHDAILNLQRALRKHPLAAFQKRHKGLGEKQFARLLAVIGDPYYNDLHQRPRTVSELWAYCGFHVIRTSSSSQVVRDTQSAAAAAGSTSTPGASDGSHTQVANAPGVAPKRTRGQQSNWSEDARKRVWVIASAMPKFPGGHYEHVYRQAREKYADAVHPTECVRCGPAGKPAPAGTDLSDGHKHARAIRIVAKELLKDMWRESRDLYHPEGNQA